MFFWQGLHITLSVIAVRQGEGKGGPRMTRTEKLRFRDRDGTFRCNKTHKLQFSLLAVLGQ